MRRSGTWELKGEEGIVTGKGNGVLLFLTFFNQKMPYLVNKNMGFKIDLGSYLNSAVYSSITLCKLHNLSFLCIMWICLW